MNSRCEKAQDYENTKESQILIFLHKQERKVAWENGTPLLTNNAFLWLVKYIWRSKPRMQQFSHNSAVN
jgi:hypothetical protein